MSKRAGSSPIFDSGSGVNGTITLCACLLVADAA